jgi:hypothetical protein
MNNIPPRRTRLAQLAALGALGPAGISGLIQDALAKGDTPVVKGVNSLTGSAMVNGIAARIGTAVKAGDTVATSNASTAVIVIGKDGFLLRNSTSVTFERSKNDDGLLQSVLLTTGRVLAVFSTRATEPLTIRVPNAAIGVRGTGCYVEIVDARTYFCLCYGEAAISGPGMSAPRILKTTHHESPVWLDGRGAMVKIEKAGFVNHNDDELIMLEKLNGRVPPFVALGLTGRY